MLYPHADRILTDDRAALRAADRECRAANADLTDAIADWQTSTGPDRGAARDVLRACLAEARDCRVAAMLAAARLNLTCRGIAAGRV